MPIRYGHKRRSSVNFGARHSSRKIHAWKINKMPEFYMIFVRKLNKMPKFYMIFARKIFFPDFFCLSPSPTPMGTVDNRYSVFRYSTAGRWYHEYVRCTTPVHKPMVCMHLVYSGRLMTRCTVDSTYSVIRCYIVQGGTKSTNASWGPRTSKNIALVIRCRLLDS